MLRISFPSGLSSGIPHFVWKGIQASNISGAPLLSGLYIIQSIMPPLNPTVSPRHSLPRRIGCPHTPRILSTSGIPSGILTSWVCSSCRESMSTGSR